MKGFRIINTVLSFVLSVFLFLTATLGALYISAFNEQKILGMFTSDGYISASYNDFMNSMEALATPSYISKECYDDVFSKERYSQNLKKFFSETFASGEKYDLSEDVSDMYEMLYQNIEKYGKENGTEITDAIEDNIKEFSSQAVEKYKKYISLSFVEYYSKICLRFEKPVIIALCVCSAFTLLIVFILLKSKYIGRTALDYLSYSFLTSTIFVGVIPVYSLITGLYKNVNISPKYVYDVVKSVLLSVQNTFFVFAGILFVGGVALAVVSLLGIAKNKEIKNES